MAFAARAVGSAGLAQRGQPEWSAHLHRTVLDKCKPQSAVTQSNGVMSDEASVFDVLRRQLDAENIRHLS